MANTTYDPDSDEKYTPQHLHEAESRAAQDSYDREFNDIAANYGDSAEHPLGEREAAASERTGGDNSAAVDDADESSLYTGDGSGKKRGVRARFRSMSNTRKWLLVGAGTGGLGLIGMLVLLFLLASSLMIPNLMQNITAYQFARLTRQYSQSATRVTEEKLAADALDDASWKSQLKDKYQNLRDNTWGKFDKYRPEKVMENLKGSDNFQLTYERSPTGRLQLKGVTLTDRTYLPVQRNALQRFTPGLSSVLEFKDGVSLSRQVQPALDAALRLQDTGPIVRGTVAKKIRQELGLGLVAWTLGKYQGKDEKAARLEEARQKAATVDEKSASNDAKTSTISDSVDDAKQAAQETLDDDKKLQAAIDNGGVSTSVKDAIANGIKKSGLQEVVSVANPIYGVAMPACIVYDGSLNHSGGTIDNNTRQQVAQYQYLASAADQQKAGSQDSNAQNATNLGLAIRATNSDIGDISGTNAMKRASGQSVNTQKYISAEASAGGEYTLLNATPGIPDAVASTINSVADEACPVITNIWGATAVGLLNLGLSIFTGGTVDGAEEAAGQAASQVIERTSTNIFERIVSNTIGKAATKAGKVRDMLYDTTKSTTKIVAATVIAKLIVNERAGSVNGGFTQGQDLADGADAGGGIYSGMIEQKELSGRPLTQAEIAQSDAADQATVAKINSSKGTYERYFATSNAQSLISRVAMSVSGNMNTSFLQSLAHLAGMLFKPATYFGSFAASLSGAAHAAATDQHYGDVQFGWSEAEEKLIDTTPSYRNHLANKAVLDASGQEDDIDSEYGACFSESIGTLLSEGMIQRDDKGNVIADKGRCAPDNLGPNNSEFNDLVFRYRIEHSSDKVVDQLVDDQTITTSDDSSSPPAGTADTDTASLAQQILSNPNIELSGNAKADLQAVVQGQKVMPGPVGDGSSGLPGCSARTPTDINAGLLQVAVNMGKKYKYQINDIVSGHDCDTGKHPVGRAMDIFYIDGKPLNDSWWSSSSNIAVINDIGDIVHSTATYQFGFGVGCSATSKIQSRGNLVVFNDSCNPQDEIHIDVRGAP